MSTKIYKNHTIDEYRKKYGEKDLKKVLKADADKDSSLLDEKSWWLIEDTYYEVEKSNGFLLWWANLAKIAKIGIIGGAALVTAAAITVPIVITCNNGNGDGGNVSTINLNYHDPSDTWIVYTFDKSLNSIKTNEKNWNIKVNVANNHPFNWYIAFSYGDELMIARSEAHEGKAVPGDYTETLTLIDGISLETYADKTLDVHFCFLSV